MGYMGLDSWGESDNAAGFKSSLEEAVGELFDSEIQDEANSYNTPGSVNIGLLIEDGVLPIRLLKPSQINILKDKLKVLIKDSSKKDDYEDEGNRLMHNKAYKRILKFIEKEEKKFKDELAYE